MKRIKYLILAAILSLCDIMTLISCSSDDNPVPSVKEADMVGSWYQERAQSGTVMFIDGSKKEDYDHIGIKLDLYSDNLGCWTLYYIKDGEMVGYDGYFYTDFEYSVSASGDITFNYDEDSAYMAEENPFDNLHYITGSIVGLCDGESVTLSPATAEQKAMLERWNSIIDYYHVAGEDDKIINNVDGDDTDIIYGGGNSDPARARKH